MLIETFAISAGGLLVWSSWRLYQLEKRTRGGKTFCGKTSPEEPFQKPNEQAILIDKISLHSKTNKLNSKKKTSSSDN